ncbi:cyclic dof factor 3-like [Hibiscus syriacus]|uniref:Cyclic dof factor 3-like n=1 Tax=Hibiscus syriacus TaxID=106335 RepID=A0A6A2YPS6_HIBSY|nr:cyclic dof factor 3-like [Hibiscus syriacus]
MRQTQVVEDALPARYQEVDSQKKKIDRKHTGTRDALHDIFAAVLNFLTWKMVEIAAMDQSTVFRILVILLGLSQITSLNAVPVSRIGNPMHGSRVHQVQENTHLIQVGKSSESEIIKGRMFVELNDYPGSGANNRHTPRP